MTAARTYRAVAAGVLEKIMDDQARLPGVEHCGILLSAPASDVLSSRAAFPGELQPNSFCLPQEWLLATFLEAREAKMRVAGFYHTHPRGHTLEPSLRDRAGHPPGSLVLIVGGGDFAAFQSPGWRPLPLALAKGL